MCEIVELATRLTWIILDEKLGRVFQIVGRQIIGELTIGVGGGEQISKVVLVRKDSCQARCIGDLLDVSKIFVAFQNIGHLCLRKGIGHLHAQDESEVTWVDQLGWIVKVNAQEFPFELKQFSSSWVQMWVEIQIRDELSKTVLDVWYRALIFSKENVFDPI